MSAESTENSIAMDEAWQEIQRCIDEMTSLAKSDVTASQFYQRLLDQLVEVVAAVGGAIWILDSHGRFHLEYQIRLQETGLVADQATQTQHARLLETVVHADHGQAIAPHSGRTGGHASENPSPYVLLLQPVHGPEATAALIEIFQRPEIHPSTRQGNLRLLEMLSEIASEFYRNREIRQLKKRLSNYDHASQFSELIHGSLDLRTTAYTIANEGRRFVQCDRVCVVEYQGQTSRLLAISGVDTFDRRSNAVRLLEQLVSSVMSTGEVLHYRGSTSDLPPQLDVALQAYCDEAHAQSILIVPLIERDPSRTDAPEPPRGAIVAENFGRDFDEGMIDRTSFICRHSYSAMRNATEMSTLPLRRVTKALQQATWLTQVRQLPKVAVVLLAVAGLAAALIFIPTDFTVRADGELQPANRRDLFAPFDAEVVQLFVNHDDEVLADTPLAQLESADLDLEVDRVEGEIETTTKRIQAIESERVLNRRDPASETPARGRLTAEEAELKGMLASAQRQLAILRKQQDLLAVRSPMAGRVLTWDIDQLLTRRPVRRGQLLMSVADVDGNWIAELNVPHDRIGYVLEAQQNNAEVKQEVSFILATEPQASYHGTVQAVSRTVDLMDDGTAACRVTVTIDRNTIPLLRPGTTVIARIDCGRRSLGYVLLHDVLAAIRTRLLF